MIIHFYLRFHSVEGQSFYIQGNIPAMATGAGTPGFAMKYLNNDYWEAELEVDTTKLSSTLSYSYLIHHQDGIETLEAISDRTIPLSQLKTETLQVYDTWNYAGEYQNALYTQPFQEILLKQKPVKVKQPVVKNTTHIFKVKWPLLQENETIFLTGAADGLTAWNTKTPLLLVKEGDWYTVRADLSQGSFAPEYKYGIWNVKEGKIVRYEDGENRRLQSNNTTGLTILHDGFVYLPNTLFKGAGAAIPVFSLRSKESFGVGEFSDIMLLADWAKTTGLKLIQILPVNDTTSTHTWRDSYPYSAISVFALHPIYINLDKVAGKAHAAIIKPFKKKQKQLNDLPYLDYEPAIKAKTAALSELYEAMKTAWLADTNYLAFFDQNKHWLLPYAAFCYLRDENKTSEYAVWKKYSVYNKSEIESLLSPKSKVYDKIAIHLFIQYHLHLQLVEAVKYAHKNGIIIKGDIAIGVNRSSVDTWVNPELFNMDQQAGAPPDAFAVKGQNWGFPTYNWKQMRQDNYSWWRQRFSQMSHYFDAFRIDHILGFFRIWSIPSDQVEGIMGKFVPSVPVYRHEFDERGIYFDRNRYCKPLINDTVISELFGKKGEWVKKQFLDAGSLQQYQLKQEFNTQRKIEQWCNEHIVEVDGWIKDRLFDLVSNVILFEEPGNDGKEFHFRFSMDTTISYRYLDGHTKWQLKELYNNYFFQRQDQFWRYEALEKLPALKAATNMLICGEDLGLVPDCVPGVMKDLGILSLEIQRMPKNPAQKFFHPATAPYLSVVTPSTHDMSTIRGWWEESRETTQQFFNFELGHWGLAPYFCDAWVNKEVINQHVHSPAMWSIFQLQDLFGMDAQLRKENPHEERINIPSNPKHFWRYRMHLTLEDLLKQKAFNQGLKQMVEASGRL